MDEPDTLVILDPAVVTVAGTAVFVIAVIWVTDDEEVGWDFARDESIVEKIIDPFDQDGVAENIVDPLDDKTTVNATVDEGLVDNVLIVVMDWDEAVVAVAKKKSTIEIKETVLAI